MRGLEQPLKSLRYIQKTTPSVIQVQTAKLKRINCVTFLRFALLHQFSHGHQRFNGSFRGTKICLQSLTFLKVAFYHGSEKWDTKLGSCVLKIG